ncbi:MAG: cobalamin B12-binding domain-containing protein, partial [Chloroflexi bacterium]|nr:cobalamin B12-binding domain-containing protein [Chloroflexota bacterium]
MQPYPPLGTLYAAGYVRARGYDVALFDAMLADSEADWARALDREQPRIAVLYEDNFNYLSKMCLLRMRQAALTMIDHARARGCTVVVAGSDATDHADLYLAQGADYVVVGEGEQTLAELLDHLSGRTVTSLESIRGLAYPHPTPLPPREGTAPTPPSLAGKGAGG